MPTWALFDEKKNRNILWTHCYQNEDILETNICTTYKKQTVINMDGRIPYGISKCS